jgi:hypothetical protein
MIFNKITPIIIVIASTMSTTAFADCPPLNGTANDSITGYTITRNHLLNDGPWSPIAVEGISSSQQQQRCTYTIDLWAKKWDQTDHNYAHNIETSLYDDMRHGGTHSPYRNIDHSQPTQATCVKGDFADKDFPYDYRCHLSYSYDNQNHKANK